MKYTLNKLDQIIWINGIFFQAIIIRARPKTESGYLRDSNSYYIPRDYSEKKFYEEEWSQDSWVLNSEKDSSSLAAYQG